MNPRKLAPAERARQLGHPEGEVGRATALLMNVTNREVYERAFLRLDLQPGSEVLEVGFGNGRFVPLLLGAAEDLRYAGVDISETMVEEALHFNEALVAAGRTTFYCSSAEAIPYPDASFDRVFAIAVIYFWPEPVNALAEMRRVLRPGGRSIIASMAPETAAALPFARPEYGFRVYDADRLVALHWEAGFGEVVAESIEGAVTLPDESTPPFRAYLIVAQR